MIHNTKIREEIETVNWKDNNSVIKFYESNSVYFENKRDFADQDELEDIARVKINYSYALHYKGHYSKAAKILKQIDSIVNKIKSNEILYDDYLFVSGMNARRLKDVKLSNKYFEQLLELQPDNDLYRDWYNSNNEFLFYKKSRIFGYIGLITLVGTSFLGDYIGFSDDFRIKLLILSFLVAIGGFYGHYIKRFLVKINSDKK